MSAVNSAPSMAVAPAPAATRLLEVRGLNSYYGDSHILFDVSLRVERNEVVALLGRNGAGKSTTLKSLMGVVTPRAGSVLLDGVEIAGMKSHAIAKRGIESAVRSQRCIADVFEEGPDSARIQVNTDDVVLAIEREHEALLGIGADRPLDGREPLG